MFFLHSALDHSKVCLTVWVSFLIYATWKFTTIRALAYPLPLCALNNWTNWIAHFPNTFAAFTNIFFVEHAIITVDTTCSHRHYLLLRSFLHGMIFKSIYWHEPIQKILNFCKGSRKEHYFKWLQCNLQNNCFLHDSPFLILMVSSLIFSKSFGGLFTFKEHFEYRITTFRLRHPKSFDLLSPLLFCTYNRPLGLKLHFLFSLRLHCNQGL